MKTHCKEHKTISPTIKPALLLLVFSVLVSAVLAIPLMAMADPASPAIPTGLSATAKSGEIDLAWTANTEPDLAGYNIYRDTTSTAVGGLFASVDTDTTSFVDTSTVVGTTYFYWLSAFDTSTPSNESTLTAPVSATVAIGSGLKYKDVTNAHWAREYIDYLIGTGVVAGYPDGTFRPNSKVSRAEFAKMVWRIMTEKHQWTTSTQTAPYFSDVSSSYWAFDAIQTVAEKGVMLGYNTTSTVAFKPGRNITRAEIAKIISAVLKLERGKSNLKDVNKHWAKEHINACVQAGIIGGFKNGNFEPSSYATRAEVCKMLAKMMKLLDVKIKTNNGKNNKTDITNSNKGDLNSNKNKH